MPLNKETKPNQTVRGVLFYCRDSVGFILQPQPTGLTSFRDILQPCRSLGRYILNPANLVTTVIDWTISYVYEYCSLVIIESLQQIPMLYNVQNLRPISCSMNTMTAVPTKRWELPKKDSLYRYITTTRHKLEAAQGQLIKWTWTDLNK